MQRVSTLKTKGIAPARPPCSTPPSLLHRPCTDYPFESPTLNLKPLLKPVWILDTTLTALFAQARWTLNVARTSKCRTKVLASNLLCQTGKAG